MRITGAENRKNLKSETLYQLFAPKGLYMFIKTSAKTAVNNTSFTIFPFLFINPGIVIAAQI